MARKFLSLVVLVWALFGTRGYAQVAASANKPFSLYAYGDASVAQRELGYGKALGYSGGIILQHSRWLALDGRGVIMRERIPLHTYLIEAGPRISHRYGSFVPYVEFMAGLGRTGYGAQPLPLQQAYGFAYTIDEGVEWRIKGRFSWRIADFAYNRISAGSGASPLIGSTGIVYRIF